MQHKDQRQKPAKDRALWLPLIWRLWPGLNFVMIFGIAGCSIERSQPDFTYPPSAVTDQTPWPELQPTNSLVAALPASPVVADASSAAPSTPITIPQSRIDALRARAANLARESF